MDYTQLIEAALAAAEKAYAPYSHFRVGTAVLLEDGMVVTGNNQENRAYPLGSCAERVAVNYARAMWPERRIVAVAVASPSLQAGGMIAPCGGCREVLLEAERAQMSEIQVVMYRQSGDPMIVRSAAELLPYSFELPAPEATESSGVPNSSAK